MAWFFYRAISISYEIFIDSISDLYEVTIWIFYFFKVKEDRFVVGWEIVLVRSDRARVSANPRFLIGFSRVCLPLVFCGFSSYSSPSGLEFPWVL